MSILQIIQSQLKAPKGQTNSFGNYKYRSCEDIVEAVKPLLAEYDAHLNISDEIIMVGDRIYVKATARIMIEDKIISEASASAREPLTKKGMDEAQITGATSSYARKYALNGLLAIDDTKDADTQDNSGHHVQVAPDPIRQKFVDRAVEVYREELIADKDEPDYERMQKAESFLTNDEKIAALDAFGKEKVPETNRMFKNVINECLKWRPSSEEVL